MREVMSHMSAGISKQATRIMIDECDDKKEIGFDL